MTTSVVTGGAGFIGSHLAEALVARGDRVRILDDLSTGHRENLAAVEGRVDLRVGSICDPEAVQAVVDGADYVFHEAALASVPLSLERPLEVDRVNVGGTLQVLEAARAAGVKRVVLAASCAAYGDPPRLPSTEDDPPLPLSPYAATKVFGELYARVYTEAMNLPVVALRYFNVFGPRQDPAGPYAAVIPLFAAALAAGRAPVIFGSGEQSRDFVYVANVVDANLLASTAAAAPGRVYNVASGRSVSLNELAAALDEAMGVDIRPRHTEVRAGDILHSSADITRARRELGYEPVVSFDDGLRATVAWYISQ